MTINAHLKWVYTNRLRYGFLGRGHTLDGLQMTKIYEFHEFESKARRHNSDNRAQRTRPEKPRRQNQTRRYQTHQVEKTRPSCNQDEIHTEIRSPRRQNVAFFIPQDDPDTSAQRPDATRRKRISGTIGSMSTSEFLPHR